MSTFYGNFTDNSKPSFQFDRIYPNYTIMRLLEKSDGIFIGRQVLIEYDLNPIDFFLKYASDSNFNDFFISKNISFSENNTIVEINGNTWTNNKTKEECYSLNETIDTTAIYDSTVWEKIYTIEDGQKYIKIANLNAVIPTLQINNINPTTGMEIISTGVPGSDYYKLDIPKNWNFGVKEIDYYEAPLNDSTITGTVSDNINYIKVEPNEDADTQELSIHLPAIGNAVAKMNKVIAEMGTSDDPENNADTATWWARFKYFDKITQNKQYLTETAADARYLSQANATANYLTKAEATGTTFTDLYLTKAEADDEDIGFVRRNQINNLSSSIQNIEEDTSTTTNYASNNSWLDINRTNNNISIAHKKTQANYYDTNNQAIKYFGGATGNSSSYGGIPFFTPQFNIDAAGHITSITNHSYSITGSNWIENNQSYSSTGHILNTIIHKEQPQLYNENEQINKILDRAGHITDIENNQDLMDALFYKENEIIEINTFVTGYITSSTQCLRFFIPLEKILRPGYTVSLDGKMPDITLANGNVQEGKRFDIDTAAIRIFRVDNDVLKCNYVYVQGAYAGYLGGPPDEDNNDNLPVLKPCTAKAIIETAEYMADRITDEQPSRYGRLTIKGRPTSIQVDVNINKPLRPASYGATAPVASTTYPFLNNSNFVFQTTVRGKIIKTNDGSYNYWPNSNGVNLYSY